MLTCFSLAWLLKHSISILVCPREHSLQLEHFLCGDLQRPLGSVLCLRVRCEGKGMHNGCSLICYMSAVSWLMVKNKVLLLSLLFSVCASVSPTSLKVKDV